MLRARATVAAIPLLLAALAAATAVNVGQPLGRAPVYGLFAEVSDVVHGRAPMVDTSATNGWLSLDLLGAVFSFAAPSEGRVMLATSALAAVCAVLFVGLAFAISRSVLVGTFAATAAVLAAVLGPEVADAYAPSSGALTLVLPLAVALVAGLGAGSRAARQATLLLVGVGVAWGPASALLTLVAAGGAVSAWAPQDRRRALRLTGPVVALALVALGVLSLAQSGALPSPGAIWTALDPASRLDEPGPATLAAVAWGVLALVAAALAVRPPQDAEARMIAGARAAAGLAVVIGLWAVLAGSTVGLGYALALAATVVAARSRVAGVVVLVLVVATLSSFTERWERTALYDALPHQVLSKVGLGPHVGGSLRYDLELLWRVTPRVDDPVLALATRRGDELLLLGDPGATAQLLAGTGAASLLPVGDPTRPRLAGHLRGRIDDALDTLPDGARLLTRSDWYDAARAGIDLQPTTAVFQALQRVVAQRRTVETGRGNGAVLLTLRPRVR